MTAWIFFFKFGAENNLLFFQKVPLALYRIPEFLLGIAIAWLMRLGWRTKLHTFWSIFLLAASLGLISLSVLSTRLSFLIPYANEIFTLAVGAMIVIVASRTLDGKKTFLDTRWQVKLGEWSFAFYLVHATFIYLALTIFGYQPPSWKNFIWIVPLLLIGIAAAAFLFRFIEKPIEKRIRTWRDNKES